MKEYYQFTKTNLYPVVYMGAIMVVETLKTKNGISKMAIIQGKISLIKNQDILEKIINSGNVKVIDKPSDEFLNSYVYKPKELVELTNKFNSVKKNFNDFSEVFSAILMWVMSTKGSPAVNIKTEESFLENPEKVLKDTKTFGNGMKAKPGAPHANRAPRTTVIVDIEEWEKDGTSLFAGGIKKNESMTFQGQIDLFNKLIQTIIDIYDTPEDLRETLCKTFNKIKGKDYRTEFYLEKLSINKFKDNQHHNKIKGCELMHIDPSIEFASRPDNLKIGTSEENRHQGGYTFEFTDKKLLIKKIYEKGFNNDPEYLNTLSLDELEEIYYKNKFSTSI
jgi:hypothetical protein